MVDQSLLYGDQRIPYRVVFKSDRARKLAIHVHPDGVVEVDAPQGASLTEIKHAVTRRARWLSAHLARIDAQTIHVLPREYVSGESHFYLGRRHQLKVRASRSAVSSVRLWQGRFEIVTDERRSDRVRALLWDWYKARARVAFEHRLEQVCDRLVWLKAKPRWKLLAMKKQWGSCSPNGVLSLNPHLIKAPVVCIDYVLLHELCHLKFHNHSRQFYNLLGRQMPQWKTVKRTLDGMAEMLLSS